MEIVYSYVRRHISYLEYPFRKPLLKSSCNTSFVPGHKRAILTDSITTSLHRNIVIITRILLDHSRRELSASHRWVAIENYLHETGIRRRKSGTHIGKRPGSFCSGIHETLYTNRRENKLLHEFILYSAMVVKLSSDHNR